MSPPTLSQKVIESIAQNIVTGKLPPGRKLDELSLARQYKVSRTPVREALRQLTATRLVQYVPRTGFSVAPIDAAMLDDLFEAASETEALCAGLCALRARATDRTRLEALNEQARKAAKNNPKHYAALNEDFHQAIYIAAGNRTLEHLAIDFRRRLAPFRARQFYSQDRIRTSVTEHDDIVEAIMVHDKPRAEAAMRRHISSAAVNVSDYFQRKR